MTKWDKVILAVLVSTNAFTIALWFFNGLVNVVWELFGNPYTGFWGSKAWVIAFFSILAGLAIDLFMIGLLNKKEHNLAKFMAPIVLSVVSALIVYHFFNGSFTSYHAGHLLHSMWAFLPMVYMLYFAETVSRADRERQQEERRLSAERAGKVQCPHCGGWYKKGRGITVHMNQRCKKNPNRHH